MTPNGMMPRPFGRLMDAWIQLVARILSPSIAAASVQLATKLAAVTDLLIGRSAFAAQYRKAGRPRETSAVQATELRCERQPKRGTR